MIRRNLSLSLLVLLGQVTTLSAQESLLAPNRRIDWGQAGVRGGISHRTTVCAVLDPGATAAQINTAIASCPSGQVVKLNAGTYNLTSGIVFNGKDNVTLRGAGPDATFLRFSGVNPCGGKGSMICVKDTVDQYLPESPGTVAAWTGGFAKGTTVLTLSTKTNLQIGTTMVLDQIGDNGDADPGTVFVCDTSPTCAQSGGSSASARLQAQLVTVTSIEDGSCAPSCDVGISPGLYMPNWRSTKSPRAFWSSGTYVTGVGLEDFSLQYSSNPGGPFNIVFYNAQDSWVRNVRSITPIQKHVLAFFSHHITVRDSYFFGTTNSVNDSYGFDSWYSSDALVENNIFQRIAVPMMNEPASTGHVYAYNYAINDLFDSRQVATSWMQGSSYFHAPGSSYVLWEGNDGPGVTLENYFGVVHFITGFRNRWHGWEPSGVMENQTVAIHQYARNRYTNWIGNVLGTDSYHRVYETYATGATSTSGSDCVHSIYAIGLGWNCASGGGATGMPTNDVNTRPTIMRWGNYDTVNDGTRWVPSEVPTGIAAYPNPLPSSETLPPSFYLAAKPSWFGSAPWPAIGPDVTGGSEPGVGGHNAKIPARRCFETVMGGTFGDTSPRTFNAASCYGPPVSPPLPPSGVRVVP